GCHPPTWAKTRAHRPGIVAGGGETAGAWIRGAYKNWQPDWIQKTIVVPAQATGVVTARVDQEIDLIIQRSLIEIRQKHHVRTEAAPTCPRSTASRAVAGICFGHGKRRKRLVISVQRQSKLFQVILALTAPRRLARLLHGWQQQGDEDRD